MNLKLETAFLVLLTAFVITGCNILGGNSTLDQTFRPGLQTNATPTEFTQNFQLNSTNASNFSFNSSRIDFTSTYAELTSANQTDNSNTPNGFAGGTLTGVTFDSHGYTTDGIQHTDKAYLRLDTAMSSTNHSELDASWTPKWDNLKGYWKLNDLVGAPAVIDSTGTHTSSVGSTVTLGVVGKLNSAASFDGTSNSYINTGNGVVLANGSITLSAWAKKTANGVYNMMICQGSNAGPYSVLQLGFRDNNGFFMGFQQDDADAPIAYTDRNWHFWTGTYETTTKLRTLYVDGIEVAHSTAMQDYQGSGNIFISACNGANFNGSIDEVAVWNTALSAPEISTIYSRQSAKYAGTYTSRVIDAFNSDSSWSTPSAFFSWIPTLPFFKELSDSGMSETQTDYSSQTANLMSEIVGLWHFDETSAGTAPNGTDYSDHSGNGFHGTQTGGVTFGKSAVLGKAAGFNGSSYISMATPMTGAQTEITTYSRIWFNSFYQGSNGTRTPVIANWNTWSPGSQVGFNLGMFHPSANVNFWSLDICDGTDYDQANSTSTILTDTALQSTYGNQWLDIVGVFKSGQYIRIYINGVKVAENASPSVTQMMPDPAGMVIGRSGINGGFQLNGMVDETAVWTRALNEAEVLELYRRSANRIRFQVKSCFDSGCLYKDSSNVPATWLGPDNTNQTYFSELNNTTLNVSGTVQAGLPSIIFSNFSSPVLTLGNNRYFQYRTIMESDDTGTGCDYGGGANSSWCSPELRSVSVGPSHYDDSSTTISNSIGFSYATLSGFTETASCTRGIVYELSKDNSHWYYWNGSAWGLADETATNANAATVINSNIASFPTQVGTGTLYFKAFLKSGGTSSCTLSNLSISGAR